MPQRHRFSAPWDLKLSALSGFTLLIVLLTAAIGIFTGPRESLYWIVSMVWVPLAIPILAAPFVVRGYTVTPKALLVHRLLWDTRIPLKGLQEVWADPEVFTDGYRRMGNGGLFVIAGGFYNTRLGAFRALANATHLSVVMTFADRKPVVVTPGDPERFIALLEEQKAA